MVLQVEALACAPGCDNQLFQQNDWVQANLVKALSASSSSVDGFGNPITANASTDGSALPGALQANMTADGLNGGIAGAVVNASWRDTIIPTGPGGPGSMADFLVTLVVNGTLGVTGLSYDDCAAGYWMVFMQATLSGPVSLSEWITDCGGTASNQTAVVSLAVGQPVLFTEYVSAGIRNMDGHAHNSFNVGFHLDPLTPCASYSTASGTTYFSTNAASPQVQLRITSVAPSQATLSWTTNAPCYVLESAPSLVGPVWNIVTNPPVMVNGAEFNVTVASTNAQQFFRLYKQ